MTLSDLTLPMPYDECKDLALVYSYDVAVLLYSVQEEHGDPRHVPAGRQLTDGRWMLCGDVLSEVGEGGILAGGFAFITPAMMEQIEVVPLADAIALLPPESPSPVN
jgi:hypothetical protein